MKKQYIHVTFGPQDKVFTSLRTFEEAKAYFAQYVRDLPIQLPEKFSTVRVEHFKANGNGDLWLWGDEDDQGVCLVELDFCGQGYGWKVEVDGQEIYSSWTDVD